MGRTLTNSRGTNRRSAPSVCLLLLLCGFLLPAFAQDRPASEGRGSYTLTYQFVHEGRVSDNAGAFDIGSNDSQALILDLEFSINDKWSIFGNLPFVTKRYNGDAPHDPNALEVHVDDPFIDDGSYHSSFQDLAFGFRYELPMTRVQLQPYIGVNIPTNDYPVFAHAAVGQGLQRLDIGALVAYQPPFSSFYYSFSLTRAFVESVQGVDVDYWRFNGEIGYFVNPRLSIKGYFQSRTGNGLESPDDFPPPRNDLHFYEHDGLLAREYVVVGLGADWSLDERNRLSFSVLKSTHTKFMHEIDYGVSVGITRGF